MTSIGLLISIAGILSAAAPIMFAVIGETITERAGVINLSMNGTILLSAMVGFAVAFGTSSLPLGFLAGALIGGLVALVVAFSSIALKQSQVAVGFVLAVLCLNLSYFLGHAFISKSGPSLNVLPIPGLDKIPILGILFFRQDIMTYLSFVIIFLAWFWIYRTRPGLMLRGIGERPAAAYVRGADVNRLRYIYTFLGGALAGLAGPTFSLDVKAGWAGQLSGLDGYGWIVLSIVIFGGWNPFRAAFGVYLFSFLQWLGLVLQPYLPNIPTQVLQVAPFPLMILTLLLVNIGNAEWMERSLAAMPPRTRRVVMRLLRALRASPPASLGVPFESE
ncbi:MAG: ABC transporter permease [Anaerolineales bacterium]